MVLMLKKMKDKREEKRERFVIHCDVCGRYMHKGEEKEWTEFQPKSRGTKAYICPDCMEIYDYNKNKIKFVGEQVTLIALLLGLNLKSFPKPKQVTLY